MSTRSERLENEKTRREDRMAVCQHYSYDGGPKCAAGIDQLTFNDGKDFGCALKLPCWGPKPRGERYDPQHCDSYLPHTALQIEQQDIDDAKGLANYVLARQAVTDHIDKTGEVSGNIPCPICDDGRLTYRKFINGHVHGKCTTEGCTSWME